MAAKRILFSSLTVLLCIVLAFSNAQVTRAESGTGTRTDPVVISSLPYDSGEIDTTYTTVGDEDPTPSCVDSFVPRSITYWFAFTPDTDMFARASLTAGWLDWLDITVFQKGPGGDLTEFACSSGTTTDS